MGGGGGDLTPHRTGFKIMSTHRRILSAGSGILLLLPIPPGITASGTAAEEGRKEALPFDPAAISRLSLDGVPRSLAICQGGGRWLGYDLERAAVFKAWQAPEGKGGLAASGFTRRSVGEVRFEDGTKDLWEWRGEGGTPPTKIRYLGCSQREGGFELRWELRRGERRLRLVERVAAAAAAAGFAMREIRVEGLGEGEALLPPAGTRLRWSLLGEKGETVEGLTGSGWHRLTLP